MRFKEARDEDTDLDENIGWEEVQYMSLSTGMSHESKFPTETCSCAEAARTGAEDQEEGITAGES
jgi:hypothetical protein